MSAKKIGALAVVLSLCLVTASSAGERSVQELNEELAALTQAVSAQSKLLELYEKLGKHAEAATARARIVELAGKLRKVLEDLLAAVGAGPIDRAIEPPAEESPAEAAGRIPPPNPPATGPAGEVTSLALRWLADHQDAGGHWDSDRFPNNCDHVHCTGPGSPQYDPGVTGLALMAFLGVGKTHKAGEYKLTVKNGLKYLKQIQDPEGCFGTRRPFGFVYNHAIATQAMIEAYALTGSPLFKQSAQLGVDFVHKAQNPYLAWRYGVRPGENDTSVTAWMVAALDRARMAGLRVDEGAFTGALAWLEKVTEPEYGRVGYTVRGNGPARMEAVMAKFPPDKSESLTAAGILIRTCCGVDPKKDELLAKGVDLCLKVPPVWNEEDGSIDMYYWFWGTLAMRRVGGGAGKVWLGKMRDALAGTQRRDGGLAGSWDPVGAWGTRGGRIYSTAVMAVISGVMDRDRAEGKVK